MSLYRSLAFFACLWPILLFGCGDGDTGIQSVWQTALRSDAPARLVSPLNATINQTKSLDATTLFDWAESRYPELFPKGPVNQTEDPYLYRYYPANKLYLGARGDEVLWMGPNTDNKIVSLGRISDYTCFVFPEACNFAPVANAGVAQNVAAGSLVTLDGGASSDANGDSLTYAWTLTSKPAGSAAVLSSATSAKPTFTADVAGTYAASLTANDGKVNSAQATVTVTAGAFAVTDAGKVTTKTGNNSHATAVLTQPDGKIVAAGYGGTSSDTDFTVIRYNQDGSLDSSFGGTGIVVTNIAGRIRSTDWVRGAAIQSDGKIVVAGYTSTWGDPAISIALVRYNLDGTLDTSFSGTGIVKSAGGSKNKFGHAIALQSDGKILIAGAVNCTNRFTAGNCTLLERYNGDGSLDSSFSGPGTSRVDGNTQGAQGLVLQSDGKILVVGTKNSGNGDELSVVRYKTDGQIDSGFGNSGVATVAIGLDVGSSNSGTSIALQADGSILVAGVAHTLSSNSHFSLTKMMTNGAVDTSFGRLGSVVTNVSTPPNSDYAYAMVIQPDGKILVAGEQLSVRSNPMPFPGFYMAANIDFAVVRYNSNGSLDTNFGANGIVITDFGLLSDKGYAIALQSDGSILVSGGSQTYVGPDAYTSFATARYKSNGSLDPTFRKR